MELNNFKCDEYDKTHYHIAISTEQCALVSRQEIVIELDREGMEYLMEDIQRQLIATPVNA